MDGEQFFRAVQMDREIMATFEPDCVKALRSFSTVNFCVVLKFCAVVVLLVGRHLGGSIVLMYIHVLLLKSNFQ